MSMKLVNKLRDTISERKLSVVGEKNIQCCQVYFDLFELKSNYFELYYQYILK